MVAFIALKAGDHLWESRRTRSAQAKMSRVSWYKITVISVHDDHVIATWNTNPPRRYAPRDVRRWRRTRPEPKSAI